MAFRVVIFQGSCRNGRMGDRVVQMVSNALTTRKHTVTVLDQKELEGQDVSLLKQPLHFYPDPTQAPEILQSLNSKIQEADALVFVTAEYNATCPPGLLNLIDHFPPASFAYKPSSIIAYSMGPFGGIRAAAALRPVLSEIGTVSVQSQVVIPTVQDALSEAGEPTERVAKNLKKCLDSLEWYADAFKMKKARSGLPQN
ncbi:quinone reductase-like [Lineus longissimus]|uniref:quinone reductase-like n=1 Tax=Lineus longissimus TaxID=88925 RepID=UPI00315CEABF